MRYREIEKEKKRRGDCDMLCYAMLCMYLAA